MTPLPEEFHRGRIDTASGMPKAAADAYAEFSPLIARKMARVEEEFTSWLGSDVDVLARVGAYLSKARGKMLRPALLLLCSGLVEYAGEHDVLFGTVFEYIHTATLVHDDIIDEAETRRGRMSVNRLWGNDLSVLVGDHLYLKAMKMALRAGSLRILDLLADVTLRMIEGELIQTHINGSLDVTEEQYLDIIERKTARLFSACCHVPAILGKRGAREERALALYGLNLGLAFQIVDDLLDLTADQKALGKPVGEDVCDGKLTLPLISLLRLGNPVHREMIAQVFRDRTFAVVTREEILAALADGGILVETRKAALSYASRAGSYLEAFPAGPFRRALQQVPDFVVSRDR